MTNCAWCDGVGRVGIPGAVCPNCEGSGKAKEQPSSKTLTCADVEQYAHDLAKASHDAVKCNPVPELVRHANIMEAIAVAVSENYARRSDEPPATPSAGAINRLLEILDGPWCSESVGRDRKEAARAIRALRSSQPPSALHGLSRIAREALPYVNSKISALAERGLRSPVTEDFRDELEEIAAWSSETKSACTCPPGFCCDKSGAAKSEQRICRDAGETGGGQ